MKIDLVPDAHALRLIYADFEQNTITEYEAITFRRGPRIGIDVNLRRARFCGSLQVPDSPYGIDILSVNGDIVQEFQVDKGAFDYLRRTFKLKEER
jgi:hypothetical protein